MNHLKVSIPHNAKPEEEFVVTFEPYNEVLGMYFLYSSFDGNCLVYSVCPLFYKLHPGFHLRAGAVVIKVAEFFGGMTMCSKDIGKDFVFDWSQGRTVLSNKLLNIFSNS